jgi:Acetokinase family
VADPPADLPPHQPPQPARARLFTGGIGEHDAEVRTETVAGLAFLGAHADLERNREPAGDADISADTSPVRVLVITAENVEIAGQARWIYPDPHRGRRSPPVWTVRP